MYRVLVACIENWDTLMELPGVLAKGGCTVDVYCSKKSWLIRNKYYNKWIESPADVIQYEEKLIELSKSTNPYYDWIILADEYLLKILSESAAVYNEETCRRILPITKFENRSLLGSKKGLSELCIKYNITTPRFLNYNHEPDFDVKELNLSFPILLKQDLSWGGGGIDMCNNQAEFELTFPKLAADKPFVFQEFITGTDIGVEAFFDNGVLLNYNAGEVTSYFNSKFSFTTNRLYFLSNEIKNLLDEIGEKFGINGFASIQLIYSETNKKFYLIEADLRPNIYVSYGRFTGQDFSEAIKKKINPSYTIPPNKILQYGSKINVTVFYRDIIRCFKQKDIPGVLKWIFNYKGCWRFIPFYDFTLFRNIVKELFYTKLFRKKNTAT